MRVICAWCRLIRSEGPGPTSFGICEDCYLEVWGSPCPEHMKWNIEGVDRVYCPREYSLAELEDPERRLFGIDPGAVVHQVNAYHKA